MIDILLSYRRTNLVYDMWGQEGKAKLSADAAGDRATDVYMGVDVFGRNTFGGGGFDVRFLPSNFTLLFRMNSLHS